MDRAERLPAFTTGCTAQRTSVTTKLFRVAVRLTQGNLLPACGRCGLRYLSLSSLCGCSDADRALRLAMFVAAYACGYSVLSRAFETHTLFMRQGWKRSGDRLDRACQTGINAFPDNEGAGPLVGSPVFVFGPAPLETPTTSHVWWETNAQLLRLALRPGSTP